MKTPLIIRTATHNDCDLLGQWNRALIREEGHRNAMTPVELQQRMRGWIASGEYTVHVFVQDQHPVGYVCWRMEGPRELHVRQFFVALAARRQGVGKHALAYLRENVWPRRARISVDTLAGNEGGLAFWRACGFADYSISLEILPDESEPRFS